MTVAEKLVLKHKQRHRSQKIEDIRFKLYGDDRFENKNSYVDNNIETTLTFFTANVQGKEVDEAKTVKSQIIRNQIRLKRR